MYMRNCYNFFIDSTLSIKAIDPNSRFNRLFIPFLTLRRTDALSILYVVCFAPLPCERSSSVK